MQTWVMQPALWASDRRNVHMYLRSRGGRLYRADSADGGVSWSSAYSTKLPNNNAGGGRRATHTLALWLCLPFNLVRGVASTPRSLDRCLLRTQSQRCRCLLRTGIDVAQLADGTLILAYNPAASAKQRTPLRLSISYNDGATWPCFWDVQKEKGEFSTPALSAWARHVNSLPLASLPVLLIVLQVQRRRNEVPCAQGPHRAPVSRG